MLGFYALFCFLVLSVIRPSVKSRSDAGSGIACIAAPFRIVAPSAMFAVL